MLVEFATGQRFIQTHHCATCKGASMLVNRWNAQAGSYEVICPGCKQAEHFSQPKSISQQWREDPRSVPVHVANKLETKYGVTPMSEQALTIMTPKAMEQRIKKARFIKDLTPDQYQLLCEVASAYGLDPVMGELIIYEGKPFPTVEGLIRIAHRSQCFAGLEDRPMTSEEKAAYGYTAPVCWLAKVYRTDWQVPAVGTGTADPNKPYRRNLVEPQFPQRMARVRAIRQALKLAFPNSLPLAAESAEEQGIIVDKQTGEIIDTTARALSPAPTNGHQPAMATTASAPPTASAGDQEDSAPICADCKQSIPALKTKAATYTPEQVAARSLKAFGRELCSTCGENETARRQGERHEAAVRGELEPEPEVDDADAPPF